MRKKIKTLGLTMAFVTILIAGILQVAKLLNVSEINNTSQEVEEIVASAGGSGGTYNGGNLDGGASCQEQYEYNGGNSGGETHSAGVHYCGRHGWSIVRRDKYASGARGISDLTEDQKGNLQETTYGKTETIPFGKVQTVPYAIDHGASIEEIQDLIWASSQWDKTLLADPEDSTEPKKVTTTIDDPEVKGRATQFANFVEVALEGDELKLSAEPTDASKLEVLVNQSEHTYTVGPYKINLSTGDKNCVSGTGNKLMKDLVYEEITDDDKKEFCNGAMTMDINFVSGSTQESKISDSASEETFVLLDGNGDVIEKKFPKFGEEFYIKFGVSENAGVIKEIKPVVTVIYWTKYEGQFQKSWAITLKYHMMQDRGEFLQNSKIEGWNLKEYTNNGKKCWLLEKSDHLDILHGAKNEGQAELEQILKNMQDSLVNELKKKISDNAKSWNAEASNVELTTKMGVVANHEFQENWTAPWAEDWKVHYVMERYCDADDCITKPEYFDVPEAYGEGDTKADALADLQNDWFWHVMFVHDGEPPGIHKETTKCTASWDLDDTSTEHYQGIVQPQHETTEFENEGAALEQLEADANAQCENLHYGLLIEDIIVTEEPAGGKTHLLVQPDDTVTVEPPSKVETPGGPEGGPEITVEWGFEGEPKHWDKKVELELPSPEFPGDTPPSNPPNGRTATVPI